MATYCNLEDVSDFLQVPEFTSSTSPSSGAVVKFIEGAEDFIDSETMHSWRSTTVSEESHDLSFPTAYEYRDGVEIFLKHRNVKDFSSGDGDKLEIWDGTDWEDYLTNKTEGRDKDFWVDYKKGILFIRTLQRSFRTLTVRVTYRYGDETIPNQIRDATVLLASRKVIMGDDRSVLLPEGTTNIPYTDKAERWKKEALEIIRSNKEITII